METTAYCRPPVLPGCLQRGNEDSHYNTISPPATFPFRGLKKDQKIFCCLVE